MARDTAPPKKKAKNLKDASPIGGIVANWDSRWKPTPQASAASNVGNADDDSMVNMGGIVSDNELDDVEREALAKEPTKIQKGTGKAKIVRYCFKSFSI